MRRLPGYLGYRFRRALLTVWSWGADMEMVLRSQSLCIVLDRCWPIPVLPPSLCAGCHGPTITTVSTHSPLAVAFSPLDLGLLLESGNSWPGSSDSRSR